MNIEIILDQRRCKNNGKFPVKIRFMFKGVPVYIPVGLDVPAENFAEEMVIKLPKSYMYNLIIAAKKEQVNNILKQLSERGILKTQFKNASELKKFIDDTISSFGQESYEDDATDPLHFKTYVENHQKIH